MDILAYSLCGSSVSCSFWMNDNTVPKLEPVTIGDLKRGGHRLLLCCLNMPYCSASEVVELARFDFRDSDPVPDLGKRYRNIYCECCGHHGFEARPVYPQAHGAI